MLINATLIVQIIHFIIAYFILRFLFFKPAIGELEIETRNEKYLKDTIEDVNVAISQKEDERIKRWQELQLYYQENKPDIDDAELYFFRNLTPPLLVPHLNRQEVERLIERSSTELKNKIRKMYYV